jgi:hypothetical protein
MKNLRSKSFLPDAFRKKIFPPPLARFEVEPGFFCKPCILFRAANAATSRFTELRSENFAARVI